MNTMQLKLSDFEPLPLKKCWLLRTIWFNSNTAGIYVFHTVPYTVIIFPITQSLQRRCYVFLEVWNKCIAFEYASRYITFAYANTNDTRQSPCTVQYASRITRVAEKLPQRHGECRNAATGQATWTVNRFVCVVYWVYGVCCLLGLWCVLSTGFMVCAIYWVYGVCCLLGLWCVLSTGFMVCSI
jgi:hypothetical protein